MTPQEWREYTEQTLVTVHDLLNQMTGLTEAIESSEAIVSLIDQWMDDRAKQEIRELPPITAAAPPSLTAQTQAEAKAPALPFKPIRETVGWQQLWRQAVALQDLATKGHKYVEEINHLRKLVPHASVQYEVDYEAYR